MSTIGKIVLDLAPSQDNPRNSEGAFITLKDGRVMFVYSRFNGASFGDSAPCSIVARYSSDGGETWSSEDRVLFTRDMFNAQNIMSVSFLRMQDGAVGLFFLIRMSDINTRLYLFRSYDEGETFDEGTLCVPPLGYFVTNNDRVIRTHTGRLIVPGNLHRTKGDPRATGYAPADRRGVGFFFFSDDDGRTWTEAADCCFPPSNKVGNGLQETGLAELKNGVVWAFFRTDAGRQYQSFSYDNGDHWSDPAPSRFTSPCSPLSVKRLEDGRLLAIWNPAPTYQTRVDKGDGIWGRTPFVAATSADEGATWSKELFVEDGSETAGYCYCAIHPQADSVLLAYCAGRTEDGCCLNRLRIRKIALSELDL